MNKTIKLTLVLAIVMLATSACKTKQKIAKIPAGANIEAKAPEAQSKATVTEATPPVAVNEVEKEAEVTRPVSVSENEKEAEVTRSENFSLVDGDQDALNFKYHVVVGSFSKQTNAKGLQNTLVNEGNKTVIVLNEKGMYRVLINSFNNYNVAHGRIREIANRFPDAWVLVRK